MFDEGKVKVDGQKYKNMTQSKGVRTRHHIRRFLHKPPVLKIHLNARQTPGTSVKGKMKNMAKSEGAPFSL